MFNILLEVGTHVVRQYVSIGTRRSTGVVPASLRSERLSAVHILLFAHFQETLINTLCCRN